MSEPAVTPISIRHYQAVCGMALVAIFLVHFQQNYPPLVNGLILVLGAVGILFRVRMSPLFLFIAMVAGHLIHQYNQSQFFIRDSRPTPLFDVTNVLLSMATLTYLLAQYRLHGLWFNVLGPDPRAQTPQARSEQSMSPAELMWLVLPIPVFAIAAELLWLLLRQQWDLVGYPPRWRQFLAIAWLVVIGIFAAGHFFRHWKRLQMDRATALLLLHDMLWNETRGEQRRINRWIAWRKVKQIEEQS